MEATVARLTSLLAKATPVPWKAVPSIEWDFFCIYPDTGKREFPIAAEPLLDGKQYLSAEFIQNNFALIVETVNALPQLLAALSAPAIPPHNEDGLRKALIKCRDKFSFYEQMHRLKCTAEGDEKADRNREMADMCDAALARQALGDIPSG